MCFYSALVSYRSESHIDAAAGAWWRYLPRKPTLYLACDTIRLHIDDFCNREMQVVGGGIYLASLSPRLAAQRSTYQILIMK